MKLFLFSTLGNSSMKEKHGARYPIIDEFENLIVLVENIGKFKVFQYFCSKLSKNLWFSNYFKIFKDLDCRRAGGGRADRPKTLENFKKIIKSKNTKKS